MRSWNAGGAHECLREVRLECGPVGQLVPMGRALWAAGQDGSVQSIDGQTLQLSGARRRAHAGYVSGLCALGARTTRQCWSYSLSDETVRRQLNATKCNGPSRTKRCAPSGDDDHPARCSL